MPESPNVALFDVLPALAARVPWVRLGELPTAVEPLAGHDGVWVKRDDVSGRRYGGNKVRTLEVLFARALAQGARRIWATGSVGSNHALATVLHAPSVGLEPGVMLFSQPPSACGRENLAATLAARPLIKPLLGWATLPWAMARERSPASFVMVPGGATPEGALGYVSAACELAQQVARGVLPSPTRIIVGVGSTCTTAGLLAGIGILCRLGISFSVDARPIVHAVRVTPWPVTSRWRIVSLAVRTTRLLATLAGDDRLALRARDLAPWLEVDGRYLGSGYGHVTTDGKSAIETFRTSGGPPLDTTYSAKAAAALLALAGARAANEPLLFWATKSSRPLPEQGSESAIQPPKRWARWLSRCPKNNEDRRKTD